jgi:Amt family ammonium transporter
MYFCVAFAGGMIGLMSAIVANLSGSAGAITWAIMDYRSTKGFSAFGFCAGAVVGLVCVTPGSGFISPGAGIIFGICGAAASNLALRVNSYLFFEDTLDVFAMHGVSGVVGNILTVSHQIGGIFAAASIWSWNLERIGNCGTMNVNE